MSHTWILAYLDPFTGSLILQLLATTLIGVGVVFRKIIFAPLGWLFRRNGAKDEAKDLYE